MDFPGEVIERHTDPSVDGFRTIERLRRGKEIKSAALPELAFRVETVLGSDGFLSCSVHRTSQDG